VVVAESLSRKMFNESIGIRQAQVVKTINGLKRLWQMVTVCQPNMLYALS